MAMTRRFGLLNPLANRLVRSVLPSLDPSIQLQVFINHLFQGLYQTQGLQMRSLIHPEDRQQLVRREEDPFFLRSVFWGVTVIVGLTGTSPTFLLISTAILPPWQAQTNEAPAVLASIFHAILERRRRVDASSKPSFISLIENVFLVRNLQVVVDDTPKVFGRSPMIHNSGSSHFCFQSWYFPDRSLCKTHREIEVGDAPKLFPVGIRADLLHPTCSHGRRSLMLREVLHLLSSFMLF